MVSVSDINNNKDELDTVHVDQSKINIIKEKSSKDAEFLKLILRFIHLMVEGQNKEIQDFLRDQDEVQSS